MISSCLRMLRKFLHFFYFLLFTVHCMQVSNKLQLWLFTIWTVVSFGVQNAIPCWSRFFHYNVDLEVCFIIRGPFFVWKCTIFYLKVILFQLVFLSPFPDETWKRNCLVTYTWQKICWNKVPFSRTGHSGNKMFHVLCSNHSTKLLRRTLFQLRTNLVFWAQLLLTQGIICLRSAQISYQT